MPIGLRALGLLAILALDAQVGAFAESGLRAEGTEFVLTMDDGRVLRSRDLVGATITGGVQGQEVAFTIAGVEEGRDGLGRAIFLHHFTIPGKNGEPAEMCDADADGKRLGFPYPDGKGGLDLACASGAVGKCVIWGYRPWEETTDGPPLRALHEACTRMVRADYGGDGKSATREGTLIFVCDRFNVLPCEPTPQFGFEAAWNAGGATCVARTRIPEILSLEQLVERYPALADKAGPEACTEAASINAPGALLINRSQE